MRNLSPDVSCRVAMSWRRLARRAVKRLGVLVGAAEIGADAVLLLGVGGAESGEPHQFGIHLGFLNDERIA